VTPPIWLDAAGRPRPTRACWTCGREVAPMQFRARDLRPNPVESPFAAVRVRTAAAKRYKKVERATGDHLEDGADRETDLPAARRA
jgi:hypothetical protein